MEKRRKQSEYCFKTIRNSVIFIGSFHKLDQLSKVKGIIIRRFRKKAHNVKAHGI